MALKEPAENRNANAARETESKREPFRLDERDPGASWNEVARQIWLAGLGVMVTTGEEGSRLFRLLVDRGRQAEPELSESWSRVREEVLQRVRSLGRQTRTAASPAEAESEETLRQRLEHLGIPTREEIANLSRKMDDLATRIEQMLHHEEGHG